MYHDPALGTTVKADPRPKSAVSTGTGIAGLVGLVAWIGVARWFGMDGPYAALTNVAATALPMVLWAVFVDKVHRNPSTGLDWANPKPLRDTLDISITKLAGLWLTWAGIACIYAIGRFYWQGNFQFAMWCLMWAAPILFVLSIPYTLWLDRYMVEPKDGCWALGAWMMGLKEPINKEAVWNHLKSWGVKMFFTAFMLAIVRGTVDKTDFQKSFARAGHAHAGVLVILALVCQVYADAAGQDGVWGWLSRSGVAFAAILMPAGFFFSSMGRGRERPNPLVWLLAAGAALLAAGVTSLGVGLLTA